MHAYLWKGLDLAPAALARIVEKVDPARFDERLDPDRFTLREALAHITDWEPIFRERIRLVATENNPTIVVYDESDRAISEDYASWDVFETLARFRRERTETVALLRAHLPGNEDRDFVHPEQGPLKLHDLANMIIGHDVYHLEHAAQYL